MVKTLDDTDAKAEGGVPPLTKQSQTSPSPHDNSSDEKTQAKKEKEETMNEPLSQVENRKWSSADGFLKKNKYLILWPTQGRQGLMLTWLLLILTIWGVAVSVLGQVALPGYETITIEIKGGTVFSLLVLVVVAYIGGWLVSLVKLPPLLGMLVVGILLKNVPYIDVGRGLDPNWSAALRSTALAVILLRAGLGLDPQALKQLSAMVFRLAFSPCLAEALVVAVASHLFLGFPWLWGFMLGFVLAAVSPAVVVPCLLSLQERGFGVKKGIPTLVIAAASVDDVLAISAFTIILGITFNSQESSLAMLILQGPMEALVGVVWGVVWGALMVVLPPGPNPSVLLRLLLLLGGSMFGLFGSAMAGVPGSGALAVLCMAFVAGLGWRRQGWADDNPVSGALASMWIVFQPLLFGLIGTEIKVSELESETVGLGVAILLCGILVRFAVSYLAVLGGELTHKERLFVSLAWIPKATVQAAVGPLALDMANQAIRAAEKAGSSLEEMSLLNERAVLGGKVLTIAVLVILITAPIGAIAVMGAGPKLLEQMKEGEEKVEKDAEEGDEDVNTQMMKDETTFTIHTDEEA